MSFSVGDSNQPMLKQGVFVFVSHFALVRIETKVLEKNFNMRRFFEIQVVNFFMLYVTKKSFASFDKPIQ